MKIKEHNATTGEIIERDLNAQELAEYEAALTEAQLDKELKAAKDAAKQAVLDKLGLTADEVAALLR